MNITVTTDEAVVLESLLNRALPAGHIRFEHPAEYLALQRVLGQLEKGLVEPLRSEYEQLVTAARTRVAAGFDGEIPGLRQ